MWNSDVESMPRRGMSALQLERLRRTVARVRERVPFFRERLGASRVEALDDLAALPFTRKSDLREHYPFGLFAVPIGETARLHASSGTKGKPTVVGYTRNDLAVWREVMARALMAGGARPGDLLHVAFGYGLFTGGLGFHDGAEAMGLSVVPVSSGNTLRQLLLLQDLKPAGICATPSFAVYMGEMLRESGGDARALGLRYGFFGAEPWTEGVRAAIEASFGLRAIDVYGLSEIVGPGVAGECTEARDGLHIAEDHFLPEIVDPATGAPRRDGEEGELVLTTLTKEALALIRYRTGDLTSLDHAPCACGRTTVRMRRITGRADDMLVVKGVNVYPSQVEAALLAVDDLAPHYQLLVDRRGTLAELEIEVEPAEALVRRWGGYRDDHPERRALQQAVAERLRAALTLSVEVRIVPPKTVPRSEGKAVRVVERKG
jgi:phenylacetate-CoA ligase